MVLVSQFLPWVILLKKNHMINQVMFDFQRLNVVGMDEALRRCLGDEINLEMHGDLVNNLESVLDPNNYSVISMLDYPQCCLILKNC